MKQFEERVRVPATGEVVTIRGVTAPNEEAGRRVVGRWEFPIIDTTDGFTIQVWTGEQDPSDGSYVHAHCAWTADEGTTWGELREMLREQVREAREDWERRTRDLAARELVRVAADVRSHGCDPYDLYERRDREALADVDVRWSDEAVDCVSVGSSGELIWWTLRPWSQDDFFAVHLSDVEPVKGEVMKVIASLHEAAAAIRGGIRAYDDTLDPQDEEDPWEREIVATAKDLLDDLEAEIRWIESQLAEVE